MHSVLKNWWIVGLRGLLAVGLAIYAYTIRGRSDQSWIDMITLPFVLVGLCAYGFFDGILLILLSARSPKSATRTFAGLQGAVSIGLAAGLSVFVFTNASMSWFVLFAVAQCWIIAMNELATGLHLRRHVGEEIAFFAAAVVTIIFGSFMLIAYDGSSHQAAVWLASFGIGMAATQLWIAQRIWSWHKTALTTIASAA